MIRVAILGAGIGREHLDAYRALSDLFRFEMLVDLEIDKAEMLRQPGETFRCATDMASALNDPDIDLIDICLPPHLHVPVSLQALGAGMHVVCEKPLATSLSDAHRLLDAQTESGKQLFPVFQYRWGPALAELRALMKAGATGPAHAASIETHWNRGADYYAVPWRGTWEKEQGGAVLGHAIHNHDLLVHLLGPVEKLSAFSTTRINSIETEDCAAISFLMESGAVATSNVTLGAAFDRTRIEIVFEHLTATSGIAPYAPGSEGWTFTARDASQQSRIDEIVQSAPAQPVGFEGFFAEISKALEGHKNQAVSLADGVASVELVTAIYHSARTGIQATLPLSRTHPFYEGWQP